MKSKHRVLILSVGAGTGHIRAAAALEKVCRTHPQIAEVVNIDALHYTNQLFRDFYSKFYVQLVKNAPTLLGWWYETSDEPWKTDKMRLMLDRMNTGPLIKLIKNLSPDIIICTHFLPAEIISHLITTHQITANLSIVVTDLDFHAMWLSRAFHHYFVALEETRVHLQMLGMPPERITVAGIPIDPVFTEFCDREKFRKENGIRTDVPLILVSAGAYSVGPVDQIARVLKYLKHPAEICLICGKNEELQSSIHELLRKEPSPAHLSYRTLGYIDNMHEWMGAADLFVGKPGGLTTAEALARYLPMVIFSPIPGQEERNSDQLLEKGIAIKCNEITTMAYKIDELLDHPNRLQQMRKAARRFSKPYAAYTIISTLIREKHALPITMHEESQDNMAEWIKKR